MVRVHEANRAIIILYYYIYYYIFDDESRKLIRFVQKQGKNIYYL